MKATMSLQALVITADSAEGAKAAIEMLGSFIAGAVGGVAGRENGTDGPDRTDAPTPEEPPRHPLIGFIEDDLVFEDRLGLWASDLRAHYYERAPFFGIRQPLICYRTLLEELDRRGIRWEMRGKRKFYIGVDIKPPF